MLVSAANSPYVVSKVVVDLPLHESGWTNSAVCTIFVLFTIVHLKNFGKYGNVCRRSHLPSAWGEMNPQSKVCIICSGGSSKSTRLGTSSKCQQLEKTYNEHGTKVETISAELDVRHTRCEGISHIRGAPGDVNQHVLRTRGYKRSGQSTLSAQGIVKNCLASQVCTKWVLVDRRVDLRSM